MFFSGWKSGGCSNWLMWRKREGKGVATLCVVECGRMLGSRDRMLSGCGKEEEERPC